MVDDVSNLTRLSSLTSDAVLDVLGSRFARDEIYTLGGPVLVAVNPFKDLPQLYEDERMDEFLAAARAGGAGVHAQPPHVFALASRAYMRLVRAGVPQSLVMSGESGAGKTMTCAFLLRFLARVSAASAASSGAAPSSHHIEEQLLAVNPVLEAFGNARTTLNNNSSRFGKFIRVHFEDAVARELPAMTDALVDTYLLERSRVVAQMPGERNFHIFYQLLAGGDAATRARLSLDAGPFAYLGDGEASEADARAFRAVMDAMAALRVDDDERDGMLAVLAGILHMGNVLFEGEEEARVAATSRAALDTAAALLGVDSARLAEVMTKRVVAVARRTVYDVPLSAAQAATARDTLAKQLYGGLFEHVVRMINRRLQDGAGAADSGKRPFIGVLDIYGFEICKENGLDQVLINYANERIQKEFAEHMFVADKREHDDEGLAWPGVDYEDNSPCVELFERRRGGIFACLDEEARLPNGSDAGFVFKMHQALGNDKDVPYTVPRMGADTAFVVDHFAGSVHYTVDGFLERNKEAAGEGSLDLLATSSVATVRSIGTELGTMAGSSSVCQLFKQSLLSLTQTLAGTEGAYIRCIKSNADKVAGVFDRERVGKQLRAAGVLSSVELANKSPFPRRLAFADVLASFSLLAEAPPQGSDDAARCEALLAALGLTSSDMQLGRSRVFFSADAMADLEARVDAHLAHRAAAAATSIQGAWRGHQARVSYVATRRGAVRLQARLRGLLGRRLAAVRRREVEEAERRRREAEEEERRRQEAEEAERRRQEAEEAERRRQEAEEAERRRQEAEEAERRRQEAEEEERRRQEEEERRRQAEEDERRRQAEAEEERRRQDEQDRRREAEEEQARLEQARREPSPPPFMPPRDRDTVATADAYAALALQDAEQEPTAAPDGGANAISAKEESDDPAPPIPLPPRDRDTVATADAYANFADDPAPPVPLPPRDRDTVATADAYANFADDPAPPVPLPPRDRDTVATADAYASLADDPSPPVPLPPRDRDTVATADAYASLDALGPPPSAPTIAALQKDSLQVPVSVSRASVASNASNRSRGGLRANAPPPPPMRRAIISRTSSTLASEEFLKLLDEARFDRHVEPSDDEDEARSDSEDDFAEAAEMAAFFAGATTRFPDVPAMPSPPPALSTEEMLEAKAVQARETRRRIVDEILSSERSYLESLELMIKFYYRPLNVFATNAPLIGHTEIRAIFSNVQALIQVSRDLLGKLETRSEESSLGELLLEAVPALNYYTVYVNNYDTSLQTLSECRSKHERLREFLDGVQSIPAMRNLDLSSFLIMPIQRIPRYELLLRDLLKYTPDEHADKAQLEEALAAIQKIAQKVNDCKERQERMQRVLEIQERFSAPLPSGSLVQPHRHFVRQDKMTKKPKGVAWGGRGARRRRHFFLFNDIIIYAARSKVTDKYDYKGTIPLLKATVRALPDSGADVGQFEVRSSKGTIIVLAEDNATRDQWVADIGELVEKLQHTGISGVAQ